MPNPTNLATPLPLAVLGARFALALLILDDLPVVGVDFSVPVLDFPVVEVDG